MKQQKPYRRTVEIYFVLYLAAMLLLLPDERDIQHGSGTTGLVSALLQTNFSIVPEKNYLTARLQRNALGAVTITIDSVNTIAAIGNVRDVRYEFYIEDKSLGETLRLTSTTPSPTRIFTVLHDPASESATFVWRPRENESQSRIFTVRVVAKAKPVVPPAIRGNEQLRRQLEEIIANEETALTARTQFEVVISFGDNPVFASGNGGQSRVDTLVTIAIPPAFSQPPAAAAGGDPVFDLEFKRIDVVAGEQWNNEARLYNLDLKNGVAEPPKVIILGENNNGSAYVDHADANSNIVRIRGLAPTSGVMRVQLMAKRASDSRQVVAEFIVRPGAITQPYIPESMYAGRAYDFDPKLPMLTGQEVSATLYEGLKERVNSNQGQAFTFMPQESDIGKTLRFERYINGKKVGESYAIPVMDYLPPRVVGVYTEPTRVVVKTQGFGPRSDIGKRVQLSYADLQNCSPPREIYGDYTYDTKSSAHIQVFELLKIDKSKPVSGKVFAVDQKKRTSDPYEFE